MSLFDWCAVYWGVSTFAWFFICVQHHQQDRPLLGWQMPFAALGCAIVGWLLLPVWCFGWARVWWIRADTVYRVWRIQRRSAREINRLWAEHDQRRREDFRELKNRVISRMEAKYQEDAK